MTTVTSLVCGYCSTGCSLDVRSEAGRAVSLVPTAGHVVNRGLACPKGWEALAPLSAADRGTSPLLRRPGGMEPIDWYTANDTFVQRMSTVLRRHGPESAAFLSTGQITTEEMALLGAFAKFGMGMLDGDSNTRQCMATSVVAYREAFGFDAPPYTYADLEHSDVVVLIGSNLCVAHPVLWARLCANPHRPEVIVVDPRRTETAMAATQHLALAPKSDLVLLYGLARLLIDAGAVDTPFIDAHTIGFDRFAAHVEQFTLEEVSRHTGLPAEQVHRCAETIAAGERVSFWWTMGVNQSHQGVRTAQAVIALALLTGNIGRPGTGANSVTGQCNAMGSRLFSNTGALLGGRDFGSAADRADVAAVLSIDEARIPRRPSVAYDEIVGRIERGRIRALWVVATNGVHSWIGSGGMPRALEKLDFLVVQDLYPTTDTAMHADLFLPAAGWGEKTGTFINSERRFGMVHRVCEPPTDARADFEIFVALAEAWGCTQLVESFPDPSVAFQTLRELSRGQPFDFTGIRDFRMIERSGGVQWPCPEGSAPKRERRLFGDGVFFHPDGRARFVFEQPQSPRWLPHGRFDKILLTGRGSVAQWHTGTRTDKSAILRGLAPRRPTIEIAPGDAEAMGVSTGDLVWVRSRRGEARVHAVVAPTIAPGHVFMAMHFAETNRLTEPEFDPFSRQPSYKHTPVSVEPVSRHEIADE